VKVIPHSSSFQRSSVGTANGRSSAARDRNAPVSEAIAAILKPKINQTRREWTFEKFNTKSSRSVNPTETI
jgi:hypothetical protein